MTIDSEHEVRLLIEERAICRLIDRWSEAMDQHDWEAVSHCLAEQFCLSVPPYATGTTPKPRATAISEMASRNEGFLSFHCVTSKSIEISGETARVRGRLVGGQWQMDKSSWEIGFGFYEFDVLYEAAQWLIAGITLRLTFVLEPHPRGFLDGSEEGNARLISAR